METKLIGKNALVCGGSKGIGKAIAIELAKLGASITVAARSPEVLSEVVSVLDVDQGQDHDFLVVDMNDTEDLIRKVHNLTLTKTIHILINNSGGPPGGPILDATEDEFVSALTRHLIANHHLVRLLSPRMKESGYGRIINVISTSVKEPIPGLGVSNTTRGAVASWAKTVAMELGPFGITVNNVLPGFTRTGRLTSLFKKWAAEQEISLEAFEAKMVNSVPLGRIAAPEEVAAVAAFLASPSASYVSGVSLPVDGGRTRGI